MKRFVAAALSALMLMGVPAMAEGLGLTLDDIQRFVEIRDFAEQKTPLSAGQPITIEQAQQIALEHAQLAMEDVVFLRADEEWEDGREAYDIAFLLGATEFDYEIDQMTGEIRSFDVDAEYLSSPFGEVDAEQALTIALEQAELTAEEVRAIEIKAKYDDGQSLFEIKFLYGHGAYEFEIDAYTGGIIEWDRDFGD